MPIVVPIFLNLIQRLGPWHVRPIAYVLFRPGSLALYAASEHLQRMLVMQLVTLVANAAVFGALAYGLRYGFLFLIGALLTINFLSLPPSDAKLERNFSAQQINFERLIQEANQMPSLVRIAGDEIEDSEGRKYRDGDAKSPLSAESWREYRELLQKTGMKEGLYRSPQTGKTQFLTATLGWKVGAVGTLYGYVYCPVQPNATRTGLLPCSGQRDEYDIGDYRYKRLSPEWSIVEIFQTRSLIN